MLVSQLIVAPVLVFEAWLYLYVGPPAARRFDWAAIAVAALACLGVLPLIAGWNSGANDRIWHPVLSTLTSFFIFPAVLGVAAVVRARLWGRRSG